CQAITRGTLSIDSADALRRGLGKPGGDMTAEKLRALATELLSRYSDLPADALFQRARAERDLNDLDGIAARQQELYLQGGFRLFRKANGMYGYAGQADPESAAVLLGALDPLTSPRRGGPRFTRPEDVARAQAVIDDPRTTDRITLDGLVALVKSGSQSAGPTGEETVPNGDHTLVKVVVAVDRTGQPSSFAEIESTGTVIPLGTAEAALCDATWQEVTIDTCDNPLDVGRRQRLFSRRQRGALAVRDGGCLWPECTQPPAFTEAHHIEQWKRDRGRTDVGNGILLCRFHHLLLHNNRWEIHRDADGRYWLTPPTAVDPQQTAIRLESRSTLSRHRRREREGVQGSAGRDQGASVALLI
ncbi:HNH endonuclease signature motif containing protein, partial [Leifsonella bigeumensis]|uniref:HNH endonuclease signature motif containing protein n=1 Tax=Leifsonella bigeumensis TaxID=433643 RepID=UPI0031D8CC1D